MDYIKVAQAIRDVFKDNVIVNVTHCLTRLRIKTQTVDVSLKEKIKNVDGVLGVISANNEYQIIIGPGHVDHVYDEFVKIVQLNTEQQNTIAKDSAKTFGHDEKILNQKKHQNNIIANSLSKFAKIFAPIIPAFIAAGILASIASIIQTTSYDFHTSTWKNSTAQSWYYFFDFFILGWQTAFLIFVGYQFMEVFGGKGWIGGLIGLMFTPLAGTAFNGMLIGFGTEHMSFLGIPVKHITENWMTSGLVHYNSQTGDVDGLGQATGSIFGIILICTCAIWLNKMFNKFVPHVIEYVLTPVALTLIVLLLAIFIFIPISGYIFFAVTWLFEHLNSGAIAPFGNAILVGLFLIAVVFGVHQGFIPVYVALFTKTGINSLFPVLGMAGASQVGVAIAMFLIAKKGGKLRKQIASAIVPGFLGVAEPLIYGVSLPRIVPLFCACIAGIFPGFFMGALSAWAHIHVGIQSIFGPSGILCLIAITAQYNGAFNIGIGVGCFVASLLISYIAGFFIMLLGYKLFKNNQRIQWNLE
ncbi:MAG: PTS transporter subunit EIIC [Mycoplasmataceae bacterium]|nr:PTS transporter subunit EIIC [Mycoplasmataceae bacterium]